MWPHIKNRIYFISLFIQHLVANYSMKLQLQFCFTKITPKTPLAQLSVTLFTVFCVSDPSLSESSDSGKVMFYGARKYDVFS